MNRDTVKNTARNTNIGSKMFPALLVMNNWSDFDAHTTLHLTVNMSLSITVHKTVQYVTLQYKSIQDKTNIFNYAIYKKQF